MHVISTISIVSDQSQRSGFDSRSSLNFPGTFGAIERPPLNTGYITLLSEAFRNTFYCSGQFYSTTFFWLFLSLQFLVTWLRLSGRKNVMSMRELFTPDPLAGFEKMAGFQIIYCLKIRCFHS